MVSVHFGSGNPNCQSKGLGRRGISTQGDEQRPHQQVVKKIGVIHRDVAPHQQIVRRIRGQRAAGRVAETQVGSLKQWQYEEDFSRGRKRDEKGWQIEEVTLQFTSRTLPRCWSTMKTPPCS